MTDQFVFNFAMLPRNARVDQPVQKIGNWDMLKRCLHCRTRTWPMASDERGKRRERCLCCGQRYMLGK